MRNTMGVSQRRGNDFLQFYFDFNKIDHVIEFFELFTYNHLAIFFEKLVNVHSKIDLSKVFE